MISGKKSEKKYIIGPDVLLAAFLITVAMGVYTFVRYTPYLATNDDVMLKAIVSGEITGAPDAHLIYIMYPLGWILKLLYSIKKSVTWYDFFMSGIHLAAYFLVMIRTGEIFRQSKRGIRISAVALSGLLMLLVDFKYLVLHQYTSLAATLAAVALFYVLSAEERSEEMPVKDSIITGVLLILTLWMRKQVFIMALPLFVIAFVYRLEGRFKVRKLLFPVAVGLLAALSLIVDRAAYSNPEWQQYKTYNDARTDVYDYYMFPPYEENIEEYNNLGITESDMFPLGEWDLALFENCKEDSMSGLAEFTGRVWKNLHYQKWEIRHTAKNVLDLILHQDVQPLGGILTVLSIAAPVILFIMKRRKAAILSLLALLYEGAFVSYFLFRGRFPERVSYGLYLMEFIFLLAVLFNEAEEFMWEKVGDESNSGDDFILEPESAADKKRETAKEHKEKKILKIVEISILAVTAVVFVSLLIRISAFRSEYEEAENLAKEWEECNAYFAANPENIYYLKTNSFAPYGEKMFRKETFEGGNFLRMGTWIMGSPLYKSLMKKNGVEPWNAVITNDNIYYVQASFVDTDWITKFYEGQGKRVTVKETDRMVLSDGTEYVVLSIRGK